MISLASLALSVVLAMFILATAHLWRTLSNTSPRNRLRYLLLPGSQAALTTYALGICQLFDAEARLVLVALGIGILCVLLDIPLFKRLAAAEQHNLEPARERLLEEQVSLQANHVSRLSGELARANQVRQTAANELRAIRAALLDGDTTRAEALLECISSATSPGTSPRTGNIALDALLSAKIAEARELDVEVDVRMAVPEGCPLSDVELCAVVSNLLDNALRGACTLPKASRQVGAHLNARSGLMLIEVCNPLAHTQRENRPGADDAPHVPLAADNAYDAAAPPPTEPIVPVHGWGIAIVGAIARKHDGEFEAGPDSAAACWRSTFLVPLI